MDSMSIMDFWGTCDITEKERLYLEKLLDTFSANGLWATGGLTLNPTTDPLKVLEATEKLIYLYERRSPDYTYFREAEVLQKIILRCEKARKKKEYMCPKFLNKQYQHLKNCYEERYNVFGKTLTNTKVQYFDLHDTDHLDKEYNLLVYLTKILKNRKKSAYSKVYTPISDGLLRLYVGRSKFDDDKDEKEALRKLFNIRFVKPQVQCTGLFHSYMLTIHYKLTEFYKARKNCKDKNASVGPPPSSEVDSQGPPPFASPVPGSTQQEKLILNTLERLLENGQLTVGNIVPCCESYDELWKARSFSPVEEERKVLSTLCSIMPCNSNNIVPKDWLTHIYEALSKFYNGRVSQNPFG